MASTYSPNLNLQLQATGEDTGAWGQNLNNNVFSILDAVLGNTFTLPLSGSNVTLTTSQTQNNFIVLTGILTTNVSVVFPQIGRTFYISNGTTGNFTVTLKTSATGGAEVTIPQGTNSFFVIDGTNVWAAPNVRGPAAVTNGNLANFANGPTSLGDSGVAASGGNLTAPGVITTNNHLISTSGVVRGATGQLVLGTYDSSGDAGTVYLRPAGWNTTASQTSIVAPTGNMSVAGDITANSDETLKKDWANPPSDFLERLVKVKRGTYTRIDTGARQAGVSAQDMQKVLPEVVHKNPDDLLAMDYGKASLVAVIELAARFLKLEEKLG